MSARRLNIGIRSSAERSQVLRNAMRRVARGDRTPETAWTLFRKRRRASADPNRKAPGTPGCNRPA